MSKRPWPGLFPAIRQFFYGEANLPKVKRYGETTTPTTSAYYEGMDEDYRWFRQDELVRKCVVTNAYIATMTAGFETVLEPTSEDVNVDDFKFVKEGVDELSLSKFAGHLKVESTRTYVHLVAKYLAFGRRHGEGT